MRARCTAHHEAVTCLALSDLAAFLLAHELCPRVELSEIHDVVDDLPETPLTGDAPTGVSA